MLCREIVAVFFSEILTKHINKLSGQNVELFSGKLNQVVHVVTAAFLLDYYRKKIFSENMWLQIL